MITTHEIEEIMIGKDLYNATIEVSIDVDAQIEVYSIEACYKHLRRGIGLQRCEPLNGMKQDIEDFIKSDEDTYDHIMAEYLEWTTD